MREACEVTDGDAVRDALSLEEPRHGRDRSERSPQNDRRGGAGVVPHKAQRLSRSEYLRLRADVCPEGSQCWLCGKVIRFGLRPMHPDGPSLDHVVPASQGGTWDKSNLRPCCVGCNSGRRDRDPKPITGARSRQWGRR